MLSVAKVGITVRGDGTGVMLAEKVQPITCQVVFKWAARWGRTNDVTDGGKHFYIFHCSEHIRTANPAPVRPALKVGGNVQQSRSSEYFP